MMMMMMMMMIIIIIILFIIIITIIILLSLSTLTSTFSSGTTQAFFLGNLNKRAKVIVLQIKGLANQVSKIQQQKSMYSCKQISASQKIQI